MIYKSWRESEEDKSAGDMAWEGTLSLNVTLSLLVSSVVLFYIYARYKLSYWKRKGVESPPANYVFGNFKDAFLFRSAPGWHLGEIYKSASRNAPYIGFYILHKPCLLLRDPEIIKQMFIRDFDNFSDRHFAGSQQKDSIGMRNLFGVKNPAWKYLRSKISPTLTKNKLKQMLPLMLETSKPMMQYINSEKHLPNEKKLIDAQEINIKYATDLIASIALGTKLDSFSFPNHELTKFVGQFFHSFKRMVALVTVFFVPELVEVFGNHVLFNSQFLRKVFWTVIDSREKTGEKRGDFIDSLISLKNGEQNPDYKFEGENLLFQSGTFFSGFESSATAAGFTLLELANNVECQERAREDIKRAVDKYGLTYEAFNEMKYVEQTILEGVRLHPPVSTVDRFTRNDYKIPGTDIIIEKGTPVYISLYGLQEDPKYFENPSKFDPDRHKEGAVISDAFMPFGTGPRMCVGTKVGMLHTKVVISLILLEYRISQNLDKKTILDPRSTFTAAKDGIMLYFEKIRKTENGSIK